jgi:hypothetical protein
LIEKILTHLSKSQAVKTPGTAARRPWLHLAFGVWIMVAALACSSLLAPAAARHADIVTHHEPPAWGEFYLAHDRGGHIDHHVLFHGIDRTALEHLRAADVLFLGNSRLMFALDPWTIRQFFRAAGHRYYVLGFGHEEQDDFPLEIIRSHDLRPALVVVNADQFFAGERSDWADKVIDESDFDAWKVQVEGETAHRARRVLHRLLPQYVDLYRGQREVVLYRSREDGTWFIANLFSEGIPFVWPPDDVEVPSPLALRAAGRFKQELEQRGARLVLTIIPGPRVSLHRARAMARHLSVPLIVPDAGQVRTIDDSHLSHLSAVRVAGSLLAQLDTQLR